MRRAHWNKKRNKAPIYLCTTSQRLTLAKQLKTRATDELLLAVRRRVVDLENVTGREREILVRDLMHREPFVPRRIVVGRKLLKACNRRRHDHDSVGPQRTRHRQLAKATLIQARMSLCNDVTQQRYRNRRIGEQNTSALIACALRQKHTWIVNDFMKLFSRSFAFKRNAKNCCRNHGVMRRDETRHRKEQEQFTIESSRTYTLTFSFKSISDERKNSKFFSVMTLEGVAQ